MWLILVATALIPVYGIYKQLILGEKFGNRLISDLGLILYFLFMMGLLYFFWIKRLKTELDQKEIRIQFFPLMKKTIEWKDIESATMFTYGFVGEGLDYGQNMGRFIM